MHNEELEDEYEDDEQSFSEVIVPQIETPEVFLPLLEPRRFKSAKGGRGSGKTHFFGGMLVEECLIQHTRAVCGREIQNSIKDSSKQLIEDQIRKHGIEHEFRITDREISCDRTESLIIFRGMQSYTASSIKSLEGFNRFWGDEAQTFSERSLEYLIPTIRTPGSELWFSYNPDQPTDPVETMFRENANDPDFIEVIANYYDNPFIPDELIRDMRRDQKRDVDKYNHVWLGLHKQNTKARVFNNYVKYPFVTPDDAMFQFGADWGFSVDPTVLVRLFVGWFKDGRAIYDPAGDTLFIDHEAHKVGCEIINTPRLFDQLVTKDENHIDYAMARRWQIRADSARPETISHMRNHGYPLIVHATKGPNSVVDGIEFIKNYNVVIHPRCIHTCDEFDHYKYKVDKLTQAITNVLADKKNHVIDSIRYAVELIRKKHKRQSISAAQVVGNQTREIGISSRSDTDLEINIGGSISF